MTAHSDSSFSSSFSVPTDSDRGARPPVVSAERARCGCVGLCPNQGRAIMSNPKSTASIAGHPIHPMLVAFPIAFFVATLACDIAFWRTGDTYWATTAQWLLGAGLVMAALAALAGIIDMLGEPRIRALRDVWWHAGGNILMVLIQAAS